MNLLLLIGTIFLFTPFKIFAFSSLLHGSVQPLAPLTSATTIQRIAVQSPTPVPVTPHAPVTAAPPSVPACISPAAGCYIQPQLALAAAPYAVAAASYAPNTLPYEFVQPVYHAAQPLPIPLAPAPTPPPVPAPPPTPIITPEPQIFTVETKQSAASPPAVLSTSKSDILTTHSKSVAFLPAAITLAELATMASSFPPAATVPIEGQPLVPVFEDYTIKAASSPPSPPVLSFLPVGQEVEIVQAVSPTATPPTVSLQQTIEDAVRAFFSRPDAAKAPQRISAEGSEPSETSKNVYSDEPGGTIPGNSAAEKQRQISSQFQFKNQQQQQNPSTSLGEYLLMLPTSSGDQGALKGSTGRVQSTAQTIPTLTLNSYSRLPANVEDFSRQQKFQPNFSQILLKRLQKK